jgi:3-phenylpropionate/cinnamic acid dioxygenase small subunit
MDRSSQEINLRDLRLELEELLFKEAALLDAGRFEEWLELFDDNVRYHAPVRATLARGQEDLSRPELVAHFDDDKKGLTARVRRLRTGWAHAEEPASRTRHVISNVLLLDYDSQQQVARVASNFIVFRSAGDSDERTFVGSREDLWRKRGDQWRNLMRRIIFDHNVIESISVFL